MTDEPRPACPVCRRPDPAGQSWAVCTRCLDRVHDQLGDLLDWHALATAALHPATSGDPGPIGAHREPPLPVAVDALDLALGESLLRGLDADHMGLEDWAVDWRHYYGHSSHGTATERATGRTGTLAAVVGYLQATLTLAGRSAASGGHPAIDEFADDVRKAHTHARNAVGLSEPRPWTVPCPTDDCGHRLPVRDYGRGVQLHCVRCGTTWGVERLLLVAASAGTGVWVTVAEAAEHLGVHRATVYRAVERGDLPARYGRVDITGWRHAGTASS